MIKIYNYTLTVALVLSSLFSFAITYTTNGPNSWSPSTPSAPYNGSDDFIVNHPVTLNGLDLQSGGSIVINDGGEVTLGWNATFRDGSSIKVNSGGSLIIMNLTVDNYSSDFVIKGDISTVNSQLNNKSTGSIVFDQGANWLGFENITLTNEGHFFILGDVTWTTGQFINTSSGILSVNANISIEQMTLDNKGTILGIGTVTVESGQGSFVSTGSINGCTSNCIPPHTVTNTTYLVGPLAGGKTPVSVINGQIGTSTCNSYVSITEDLKLTSDKSIGTMFIGSGVTLSIDKDVSLTICDLISNEGEVLIKNGGSLVQTSSSDLNTGHGNYVIKRVVSASENVYNSWSSPFKIIGVTEMFPDADPCSLYAFDGASQRWVFDYEPNHKANCAGNEVTFEPNDLLPNSDGVMDVGRGYFVPGGSNGVREVVGQVNNGDIRIPIYSTDLGNNPRWDDDDWNLVGNPYPCAIDLQKLYDENKGKISGSFQYWVDNNSEGNAYDQSEDYAVYANGVSTSSNGKRASQYVPTGQAFWVVGLGNRNLKFTNDIRVEGNNQNLYKRATEEPVFVYLDVLNDSNNFNQCAVGYNSTSTNGYDVDSDAHKRDLGTAIFLATLNEADSEPFVIQAFEKLEEYETKNIAIEIVTKNPCNHLFSVSRWQNIGSETSVFLKDNETGIVTDLKQDSYSVYLEKGSYMSRFQLMFENTGNVNSIEEELQLSSDVRVVQNNNQILVESSNNGIDIELVAVFNLLGKELMNTGNVREKEMVIDASYLKTGVYIIQSTLSNGLKTSNKIVFSK